MNTLWVLACNSATARVFALSRPAEILERVAEFGHESSRQHPRDLVSDKSGRVHDRKGQGRHTMEPDHDVKDTEAEEFARELDTFLKQSRQQDRYEELAVIAAPKFLGRLRARYQQWLPDAALRLEVPKDLTTEDAATIRAELEVILPPVSVKSGRERAG